MKFQLLVISAPATTVVDPQLEHVVQTCQLVQLLSASTAPSFQPRNARCLLPRGHNQHPFWPFPRPQVRYVAQVIQESQPGANGEQRPFYDFLESCLRHKAEMVIFEAARAICNMRDVTARELSPAITVLQLFLSSSKPVLRFAAVRTLNKASGEWGTRDWGLEGG